MNGTDDCLDNIHDLGGYIDDSDYHLYCGDVDDDKDDDKGGDDLDGDYIDDDLDNYYHDLPSTIIYKENGDIFNIEDGDYEQEEEEEKEEDIDSFINVVDDTKEKDDIASVDNNDDYLLFDYYYDGIFDDNEYDDMSFGQKTVIDEELQTALLYSLVNTEKEEKEETREEKLENFRKEYINDVYTKKTEEYNMKSILFQNYHLILPLLNDYLVIDTIISLYKSSKVLGRLIFQLVKHHTTALKNIIIDNIESFNCFFGCKVPKRIKYEYHIKEYQRVSFVYYVKIKAKTIDFIPKESHLILKDGHINTSLIGKGLAIITLRIRSTDFITYINDMFTTHNSSRYDKHADFDGNIIIIFTIDDYNFMKIDKESVKKSIQPMMKKGLKCTLKFVNDAFIYKINCDDI